MFRASLIALRTNCAKALWRHPSPNKWRSTTAWPPQFPGLPCYSYSQGKRKPWLLACLPEAHRTSWPCLKRGLHQQGTIGYLDVRTTLLAQSRASLKSRLARWTWQVNFINLKDPAHSFAWEAASSAFRGRLVCPPNDYFTAVVESCGV